MASLSCDLSTETQAIRAGARMPTFEQAPRFLRDWQALSDEQRVQARSMISQFIEDLTRIEQGNSWAFRHQLRVKRMHGFVGVWEMSWDSNGRATFQFGTSPLGGKMHVIWRRIGTHSVFNRP